MGATTNDIKRIRDGRSVNGGARKGAGRKPSGKKYGQYFIKGEIVDRISAMENPSKFVEEHLEDALKKLGK